MTTREGPVCRDENRRSELLDSGTLNGIDYLEVSADQRTLSVHFLLPLPADAYGLPDHPERVCIEGGERVRNIQVGDVRRIDEEVVEVDVSDPGDFSTYTLVIDSSALDPRYARCEFSFKAGCPSRFDCKPQQVCPPPERSEPLIDYMARDYDSLRAALIDLIPSLVPEWTERHEADLGMTLLELLAYAGDNLSYYQDAVANEAYLETARRRISARRHARLIDYRIHDGASARAFVHLRADSTGTIPADTQLVTRLTVPLRDHQPPHGSVIDSGVTAEALAAAEAVFEACDDASIDPRLNDIEVYTWKNRRCHLPAGSTSADLVGDLADCLSPGNFLLFEEVLGPETGLRADADPAHRQVVRLTEVQPTTDPLDGQPLTRVRWSRADALHFPLCLSAELPDGTLLEGVSVARGNLVMADHGRSVKEWHPSPPGDPEKPGIALNSSPYRFRLQHGPLSFRLPADRQSSAASLLKVSLEDVREAEPQVHLDVHTGLEELRGWQPVPDLLDSDRFDLHFVAEVDNDGRAVVRFGDDNDGMAPPEGSHLHATYRVGSGSAGNVGADALMHVIEPQPLPAGWPDIAPPDDGGATGVRNPLPASGGTDPEPLEKIRRLAPEALHAEMHRAVTEEDYARAARKHPGVSRAVATFRWTGSWHTIFIAIDPVGRTDLPPELQSGIHEWVRRYTQAGYDLEIDPPVYVPLEVGIRVCVAPDHFRGDVEQALQQALGSGLLPEGGQGFFHPDNFTFGQALHLSRLYAAVEAVQGVESALVTTFGRFGHAPDGELEQGYIPAGRLEVLRLENDPNFPERGVLELDMRGGK